MQKDRCLKRLGDLLGLICVIYSVHCGVLNGGCRNFVFLIAVLECLLKKSQTSEIKVGASMHSFRIPVVQKNFLNLMFYFYL